MNKMQQHAQRMSQQLKLLANTHRLMVLCMLHKQPQNVTTLANEVGISQTAMSNHLALLREANVIDYERNHRELIYFVSDQRMLKILQELCRLYETDDALI